MMKVGFLLSMTDTTSALWVSHKLMIRIAGLIEEAGFDEAKRSTPHKGLNITIYFDSLRGSVLAGQPGIAPSSDDPDVFIYGRASKPSGCDWIEYYVRLRYEAITGASNKLDRFLEMVKASLAAVAAKAKIQIHALDRWHEIAASVRNEVASDNSLHFDRSEGVGTIV